MQTNRTFWTGKPKVAQHSEQSEPFWERASSKLRCPGVAGSNVATKPKARFQKGFLLSAFTPQSGLANGPKWAALKKHRQRNTPATSRPAFLSGTEQDQRITVETGAFRLNDNLKGLWVDAGKQIPGEGRNRRDSTLVETMAERV